MPQKVLTTERLTLTPLRVEHTEAIIGMFADPAMNTYMAVDFSDRANAEAMMARRLGYSGPAELGHWAILQGNAVIGIAHLRPSEQLPGGLLEIGWFLARGHGGRGLATEAARALLRHGLTDLSVPAVWALVHLDNAPSLRLAERLGFLPVGTGHHYGAEHQVLVALPGR